MVKCFYESYIDVLIIGEDLKREQFSFAAL